MVDLSEFNRVMLAIVARYRGKRLDLARAVGVHPTAISKWLNVPTARQGPRLTHCLRLAEIVCMSPSVILRAAGYGEIAERIERLYGPERIPLTPPTIAPADQQFLNQFRCLERREQRAIRTLVVAILESQNVLTLDQLRRVARPAGTGGGDAIDPGSRGVTDHRDTGAAGE